MNKSIEEAVERVLIWTKFAYASQLGNEIELRNEAWEILLFAWSGYATFEPL